MGVVAKEGEERSYRLPFPLRGDMGRTVVDNHNLNLNLNLNDDDNDDESEDEFYKKVKRKRIQKLLSRRRLNAHKKQSVSSGDQQEQEAHGKRPISYQMSKNNGLTRHRKKDLKIPSKKYKANYKKVMVRRKGQVRDVRQLFGTYSGESSGINPFVSHSIRLKFQ